MLSIETTADLGRRRSPAPIRPAPVFCAGGLIWGDATLFARFNRSMAEMALDRPRVLALLSIGAGRPVDPDCLRQVALAGRQWLKGDGCLAHIHLAHARLPRLRSRDDVFRLTTADQMMQAGAAPATLMRAFGLDPAPLHKYDPEQPRVPAGSGRTSGEWMKAIGDAVASVGRALASRAVGTVLGELTAEQIASLGAFVGEFSAPTVALGLLIVPSSNDGISEEGTLPGVPNISYQFDRPAGRLKLTATDDPGTFVIARLGRGMVFHDVVDDAPIARLLNDRIVFDKEVLEAAKLGNADDDSDDEGQPTSTTSDEEPGICPKPVLDRPHGADKKDLDYEDDVHERVNEPPNVTPRGFGVRLWSYPTSKYVYLDDCSLTGDPVAKDLAPGAVVDAKGLGYEDQLSKDFMLKFGPGRKLRDQFRRQKLAAGSRQIKWYFAEEGAANIMRKDFQKREIKGPTIGFMPPVRR